MAKRRKPPRGSDLSKKAEGQDKIIEQVRALIRESDSKIDLRNAILRLLELRTLIEIARLDAEHEGRKPPEHCTPEIQKALDRAIGLVLKELDVSEEDFFDQMAKMRGALPPGGSRKQ